jgi:hypothetical protein
MKPPNICLVLGRDIGNARPSDFNARKERGRKKSNFFEISTIDRASRRFVAIYLISWRRFPVSQPFFLHLVARGLRHQTHKALVSLFAKQSPTHDIIDLQ